MLYVDHIVKDMFYVVDTDDLSFEEVTKDVIVEAVNSGIDIKNLQGSVFYPYKESGINYADKNTVVVQVGENIIVWHRGYLYKLEDSLNDDECLYINGEATPFGSMYSWSSMRSAFKNGDSLFITLYNHSIEFTPSGLAIIIIRESKDDEDEDGLYTTKIKSPVVEHTGKRKVVQGNRKALASVKKMIKRQGL